MTTIHENLPEDPAVFAAWFLRELGPLAGEAFPDDPEDALLMASPAHEWLRWQHEPSVVRDVIGGLLADPQLWLRTIAELSRNAWTDHAIRRGLEDDNDNGGNET